MMRAGFGEAPMLLGIIAGLTTCALWGLSFVAPRAVAPFSVWDFTLARYAVFGLLCLLLLADRRFRPTGLTRRQWLLGLGLGALGNIGYFVAVAFAVRYAGAAIPPVVVGAMPVFLAVIANLRERTAPWRALALPLLLIGCGVTLVNIATLHAAPASAAPSILLGVMASMAALAVWLVYGVVNAAIMRGDDAPDGLQWTGLQGIGAALAGLFLLPLVSFDLVHAASAADWRRLAVWALVMGVAGSWLATWFWMIAARRLPLALSAQLTVAQTVFGLVFGFLFEGRSPSPGEAFGAALQLVGVCSAIAAFTRPNALAAPNQPAV